MNKIKTSCVVKKIVLFILFMCFVTQLQAGSVTFHVLFFGEERVISINVDRMVMTYVIPDENFKSSVAIRKISPSTDGKTAVVELAQRMTYKGLIIGNVCISGDMHDPHIVFKDEKQEVEIMRFTPCDEIDFLFNYRSLFNHLPKEDIISRDTQEHDLVGSIPPSPIQPEANQTASLYKNLPLKFRCNLLLKTEDEIKGVYSGLLSYLGGEVDITIVSKLGKGLDKLGCDYDVKINTQGNHDWLSIKRKRVNDLLIIIDPNNGAETRTAYLLFTVNGEFAGSIEINQNAKIIKEDW